MPEITETSAQLAKMLAELGNSADEVAITLRTKGIQGIRNAARFLNPVVRYIRGGVKVDSLGLDVMQGDTFRLIFHDRKKVEVPLPHAVRLFLDAFNRGKYPDLELSLNRS